MKIVDIFRSRSKALDKDMQGIKLEVGCTSWRPKEEVKFLRAMEAAELEKYKAQRMRKVKLSEAK